MGTKMRDYRIRINKKTSWADRATLEISYIFYYKVFLWSEEGEGGSTKS